MYIVHTVAVFLLARFYCTCSSLVCPIGRYRTMESMWDEQPRGRPTFAETVSTLEETRNGLQNMD